MSRSGIHELQRLFYQFEAVIKQIAAEEDQSTKPITLNDDYRRRIEKSLGRNFSDAESLVLAVEHAGELQLDDLIIQLPPRLIERLKSRAIGVPFEKYLTQVVIRRLEEEAGLR